MGVSRPLFYAVPRLPPGLRRYLPVDWGILNWGWRAAGLRVTGDVSCLLRDSGSRPCWHSWGPGSADPGSPRMLTPELCIFSGVFCLLSHPGAPGDLVATGPAAALRLRLLPSCPRASASVPARTTSHVPTEGPGPGSRPWPILAPPLVPSGSSLQSREGRSGAQDPHRSSLPALLLIGRRLFCEVHLQNTSANFLYLFIHSRNLNCNCFMAAHE